MTLHDSESGPPSSTNVAEEELIDTVEGLGRLVARVRQAPWVAVDTEADSLYSYPERLCLMQLSLSDGEVLVDPLASLEFDGLARVLQSHRLILHGGDYDLRLLFRSWAFVPREVFDTMLAARLLGYREFGLDKLVDRLVGVQLEKGPQRANWSRRPLTPRMLEYARNDARYLKPLADRLTAELEDCGRLAWHEAMCGRLVRECTRESEVDGDRVWRLSGAHRLGRRGLAVLRALWHWRDREARRLCRPPYFVVSHETLVALAEAAVGRGRLEELLPRKMAGPRRGALKAAVAEALELPESAWPQLRRSEGIRLSATQRRQQLRLQERRDAAADRLGIDPSLIASRSHQVKLAAGLVDSERELMPWQREFLYGDSPTGRKGPAESGRDQTKAAAEER